MSHRTSGVRGFTLLEMLAATTMVAVLVGSLYASLRIAFRARDSALQSMEAVRKSEQTMQLIKADLHSAMVPNGILAGAFVGRSGGGILGSGVDALEFYAAAMDIEPCPGAGDIKKIEYSCELSADSAEMVLVRRITTNLLAPTVPEPGQEILCRGVRAFVLRYFDGSVWQENWDSGTQGNLLPKAVEVTIELEDAADGTAPATSQVLWIPCGQDADVALSSGEAQ